LNSDRSFGFFLILTGVLAAICVSRIPDFFSFDNVVFGDVGSVLTIDFLVTHGYRPVIDFGYLYGLLPIFLANLWFRAIGRTPLALAGLAFFYNLIFCVGARQAGRPVADGHRRAFAPDLFARFHDPERYFSRRRSSSTV
jgi:hypothetical protein